MSKLTRSNAQRVRQEYRARGKYAKVSPCYRCGKSAGVDYFSFRADERDEFGNEWHDLALCLCRRCAVYLESIPASEAWGESSGPAWGSLPPGKKADGR